MIFRSTGIPSAFVIEIDRREDKRGFFARTWCREEFLAHGIDAHINQASISFNERAGTLRGLHFSRPPSREAKLVRCERGRIFDVIVDLRKDSPSYCRHFAIELDDRNRSAVFVPHGCAHGFQTLEDGCQVLYMMTESYRPELSAGVRYDDPAFGVPWPRAVSVIAERDRTYPDFDSDLDGLAVEAGEIAVGGADGHAR